MDDEIRRLERRLHQSGQDVCIIQTSEVKALLDYVLFQRNKTRAVIKFMTNRNVGGPLYISQHEDRLKEDEEMLGYVMSWLKISDLEPVKK